MDQYQCAQFMSDGEEPVQARIGQLDIADPGADFDTEKSRFAHAPSQLIDSPVGFLQGDGAQRREAGGVLVDDPRKEVVLRCCQFGCAGRRCTIAEGHRNRREHLHRNAFAIHVDKPRLRRPAAMVDSPVGPSTEHQARLGVADAFDAGPLIVRVDPAQIRQRFVDGMCVDIEKACAGGPMSVDGRNSK